MKAGLLEDTSNLDFYHSNNTNKDDKPCLRATHRQIGYIVFDSRFTNYENLKKPDQAEIKFITIRRRGKLMLDRISNLHASGCEKVRVECAGNKHRTSRVYDEQVFLKGYDKDIRQITITGNGKIKPAVIITNDFDLTIEKIIRKYARRRIVEKSISETVQLKKKRNLPLILEVMQKFSRQKYPWLNKKNVIFEGASYS